MSRFMKEPIWCEYIVRPGDTFASLAARCGVSEQVLASRNSHLRFAHQFHPGAKMEIPYGPANDIRSAVGLVRNPYGHTEEHYIQAAQILADELERQSRILRELSDIYRGSDQ